MTAGVRTLVMWCPHWPLVAAGVDPAVPAVVIHANRVVDVSPAALDEGIVPGLRRRESQSRCSGLVVLDHDPARDARWFEPVVAAVGELTPWVEITHPGRCAVPTRGPSRYFGGDEALAARVAEVVDDRLAERAGGALDVRGLAQARSLSDRHALIQPAGRLGGVRGRR